MYKFTILSKIAKLISSSSEMKYNKFTLAFEEPLEDRFLGHYLKTSLSSFRITLALAIFFYASFAIMDIILFPEISSKFIFIRFGVMCPYASAILIFSFSKKFQRYWQFLMSLAIIIGGTGIIIMIGLASPPESYLYYAGLFLVLIYNYNLSKLRFLTASLAAWIILIICIISDLLFTSATVSTVWATYMFLAAANLFGMFSSYSIELFARREFYSQILLEKEKESVRKINLELEEIIDDRTEELVRINRELVENKVLDNKAQEIGMMGSWGYDIETELFHGSVQAKRILGFADDLDFIPLDDLLQVFNEKEYLKNYLIEFSQGNQNKKRIFTIAPQNEAKPKIIQSSAEVEKDTDGLVRKVTGFIQDITESKLIEQRQNLIVKILSILNRPNEWQKLLEDILLEIKEFTNLDAVAIRLKEGNSYSYYASYGFSKELLESDHCVCTLRENGEIVCNTKSGINSTCMCGYVLSGNGSSEHPLFSELGSFWTNNNSNLGIASSHNKLFAKSNNLCLMDGYESVALIPLYSGRQIIGLLHMSGKATNQFSPEIINFFEELGATIGIAYKRMISESRIKMNEERFRNLFENSPVAIWENDFSDIKNYMQAIIPPDTKNAYDYLISSPEIISGCVGLLKAMDVNDATLEMFNASSKNEFVKNISTTFTDALVDTFIDWLGAIWHGELHRSYESTIKTLDGIELNVIIDCKVSPGSEESWEKILVTVIDITSRKKAQMELEKSESSLRGLYENATIGMYRSSPNGKILMANPAIISILGYESFEELSQISHIKQQYVQPEQQSKFKTIIEKEGVVHDFQSNWIKKDGSEICVRENAKAIRDSSGEIVYYEGVIEDITSRKQSEDKLKMLAHAIEGVSECVSITDKDNIILFVNDAFQKTYGYSAAELIGQNINIVRSSSISDQKKASIKQSTINGGWKGELLNTRKDGSEFPVLISTSIIRDDETDEIMALVGVAIDITEMKRNREELINAKEMAEKSDKLKTEFLAQMSHEIRTPINSILSFSSLIKSEVENKIDPELFDGFSSIGSASKRVIRTIDMILNMSEIQTGTYEYLPKEFDLGEIITGIKSEFSDLVRSKGLELNLIKKTKKTTLFADEYSTGQIFVNLIDNAIKYTMKGKIEVVILHDDENNLTVEVHDTGIGIAEEYLPHLFDAFTQEEQGYSRRYEGNGLGLALVKKYCEINNAWVKVDSRKDKGTVFKVKFQA